ncbi:MAG: NAD(P)-dependent oxidoreductase [Rhodospirillales bacterium]|nr:MAG: NAD(P)-dependent oxidoreductase [Rhodospirillales bacterium]
MTRTVAVTGATGFIGQHLVAALAARGWRLRLLVRALPPALPRGAPVELVVGDIGDHPSMARLADGVDAVVHLAGAIKALDRAAFERANRDPVAGLLAAAAPGRPHLVLLSSLAAREPGLSDYAASKRAGEDALASAGYAGRWTAIRAPAVYGPGDRETLAFFRMVQRGFAPVPAGSEGRLSLIHVADLCAAIVATLDHPPADGVYEIDDGAPAGHTLRELAAAAGAALRQRPVVVPVPRPLMAGVAAVQQIVARTRRHPAILGPGKVREIFHSDWVATDHRLAAALAFRPRYDLATGFADTVDWYVRKKWL